MEKWLELAQVECYLESLEDGHSSWVAEVKICGQRQCVTHRSNPYVAIHDAIALVELEMERTQGGYVLSRDQIAELVEKAQVQVAELR